MAAVNATPVDTATGQIEADPVNIHATTAHIPGSRQVFRRRYSHYIDSSNNEGSFTNRANFIGTNAFGEYHDGSASIPYQNVGIAMTPTQYAQLTAIATELKVHSLGFEIKKITILQENLTTRAASTTLENTFQSRPSVLLFTDGEHLLDEVVGESGLTTQAQFTGLNATQPRLNAALISLPSFGVLVNSDATVGDFSRTYPGSQEDGALPEVSWYMRSLAADIAQIGWFLDDIMDPEVLGEGMTHRFEWKNPRPEWHKNGEYLYQAAIATNGTASVASRKGYWPPSRSNALQTYYRGSIEDHTGDNAYDSTQANIGAATRSGLLTKGSVQWTGDMVPPYNYIKMPPLWGPTSKMNFTVELWVEYFADIEWRTSGLLPYMNRQWPAGTVMTNSITSVPKALNDLRRRFGGNQGQHFLGLRANDEENAIESMGPPRSQPARKRNRFETNDVEDSN